jgi:hypothetical protein
MLYKDPSLTVILSSIENRTAQHALGGERQE